MGFQMHYCKDFTRKNFFVPSHSGQNEGSDGHCHLSVLHLVPQIICLLFGGSYNAGCNVFFVPGGH